MESYPAGRYHAAAPAVLPGGGADGRAAVEVGAGALRATVPGAGPDRFLAPEIEAAVRFVTSGAAIRAAESVTGPLA